MKSTDPISVFDIPVACYAITPNKLVPDIIEDAVQGLLTRPRKFPPKYFYDESGSRLFDRICDTPEYYPMRTEDALLARHAINIINHRQPDRIVELGSGTSRKTRHILNACAELQLEPTYEPVDVCEQILMDTGRQLLADYPWLVIEARVGDYVAGLQDLAADVSSTLFLFLGGTIGNLAEHEALELLAEIRELMGKDDCLLLGLDRVKDPRLLHAAYNDSQGITACFNLNVLSVINRELEADFPADQFKHYAYYNPDRSQIEMYLIAQRRLNVMLNRLGISIDIEEGEPILTEISRKYTESSIENLLSRAGLMVEEHFEAESPRFSLILAARR
jgi:L-histidine N-alpha-methyltransferase